MKFAEILVVATFSTGLIWAFDNWVLKDGVDRLRMLLNQLAS